MLLACGVGIVPSEDATIEALQALSSCEAVFTDVSFAAQRAWLAKRLPALRTGGLPEAVAAAKSARVGIAAWGHPQFTSALSREALALCARGGIEARCWPGVSPVGRAFAAQTEFLGGEWAVNGAHALPLADAPRAVSASGVALVVFCQSAAPGQWKALGGAVRAASVVVHGLDGAAPRACKPSELAALGGDGALVFIPAQGGLK